jgi:hypothetical protein
MLRRPLSPRQQFAAAQLQDLFYPSGTLYVRSGWLPDTVAASLDEQLGGSYGLSFDNPLAADGPAAVADVEAVGRADVMPPPPPAAAADRARRLATGAPGRVRSIAATTWRTHSRHIVCLCCQVLSRLSLCISCSMPRPLTVRWRLLAWRLLGTQS